MRTLNISLTEQDYKKYGIDSENISFDQLVEKVKNIIAIEALEKCQLAAKESGLDKMTLDEINTEIQAVRNAKSNH